MPQDVDGPKKRRTTEQVHAVILEAATAVFAEHGYDRATTRQIALAAGVAEPMIFRAFGTKRGLYDAAVRVPLDRFTEAFAGRWLDNAELSVEGVLRQFAGDLYALVRENQLVFSALSGREMLSAAADAPIAQIEAVSDLVKARFDLRWNTRVAARAAVTMIVGMALLEDVYFSAGSITRDEIVQELVKMLIGAAGIERPYA